MTVRLGLDPVSLSTLLFSIPKDRDRKDTGKLKLTTIFGRAWGPRVDKPEAEGAAVGDCLASCLCAVVSGSVKTGAPAVPSSAPEECGFMEGTGGSCDARFLQ